MKRYYFEAAVVMDADIPDKVRDRYAAGIAVDFEKALFALFDEIKLPKSAYKFHSTEPALTREISVEDIYIMKLRKECQFATITPVGAVVEVEVELTAEEVIGEIELAELPKYEFPHDESFTESIHVPYGGGKVWSPDKKKGEENE